MHYREIDLQQLISDLRDITLAKRQSAEFFASILLRDAQELTSILRQYPYVKYEPLDYHYVLLKYIPSINADLIEDLCIHFDWRGAVSAAWLTCFSPAASNRDILSSTLKKGYQVNNWLLEIAIAEIDGIVIHSYQTFQNILKELRQILKDTTPSSFVLKRSITTNSNQLEEDRNKILQAYRHGGLATAREAMRNTLYEQLLQK